MSTPNATPAAAPTATPSVTTASAPAAAAAAASKPAASNSSSSSLSTADFRSQILNKSSRPEPDFSAPDTSSSEDSVDFAAQSDDAEDFTQESVDEQVESASADEQDYSWADGFKDYRDGVHGVATAELLQALASGQLPEALMDKLSLQMVDGDEEWTGTVADLKNGAQMHANFTKKSQALAREKEEFYGERTELVDYFRSWREDESGEKGLLGLEKMLGPDAVYKIASKLAQRLERKEQLEAAEAAGHIPQGTAAIIMERESLQREVEEARRHQARQQSQAQEKEVNDKGAETGRRIHNEAVNQFKAAGITTENGELTSGVWNLFKEELQALWTDPAKAPSPVEIRTAVLAAKQRAGRVVRQHQAAVAAKKSGQPTVAGAAPAGATGAPKKSAGGPSKAMSTQEFKTRMSSGRPFSGR